MLDATNEWLASLDDASADEADVPRDAWLRCRSCTHRITRSNNAAHLAGRHRYCRANPAGHSFDFRIYADAPGCRTSGAAQTAHTWFAGYSWRIAVCERCLEHLGWLFESTTTARFGLISANLTED